MRASAAGGGALSGRGGAAELKVLQPGSDRCAGQTERRTVGGGAAPSPDG